MWVTALNLRQDRRGEYILGTPQAEHQVTGTPVRDVFQEQTTRGLTVVPSLCVLPGFMAAQRRSHLFIIPLPCSFLSTFFKTLPGSLHFALWSYSFLSCSYSQAPSQPTKASEGLQKAKKLSMIQGTLLLGDTCILHIFIYIYFLFFFFPL